MPSCEEVLRGLGPLRPIAGQLLRSRLQSVFPEEALGAIIPLLKHGRTGVEVHLYVDRGAGVVYYWAVNKRGAGRGFLLAMDEYFGPVLVFLGKEPLPVVGAGEEPACSQGKARLFLVDGLWEN